MSRDRVQGWKFAKESGHTNEDMMTVLVTETPSEITNILYENEEILSISTNGGVSQKKELSVLGHKTTPKVDNIIVTNLRVIPLSLKKSLSGQASLISSDSFFDTLVKMYKVKVDKDIINIIKLFTGEDNIGVTEALNNPEVQLKNKKCSVSQRKRRLNGESLMELNPNGTTRMLRFFSQNIVEITKMVLSTGSVKDTNSHAEYLYYKNLIDKSKSANSIFSIKDILKNISNGQIEFGPKNGGTTITLPFGHLQMHQGRLQFHHDFKKINNLVLG